MKTKNSGRVFMGLREVSGHYRGLCEGFEKIGVEYDYLNIEANSFSFKGGSEAHGARVLRSLKRRRSSAQGWSRKFLSALQAFVHIYVFLFYLVRCRYFIFSAGASFCRLLDLPVLKFFGRKVIFQFHGSDSRLPFIDGARYTKERYCGEEAWGETLLMQRKISTIEAHANFLVNIQPQSNLLASPYIQWMKIGIAAKPEQKYVERGKIRFKALSHENSQGVLRVVHSPSLPHAKGSDRIREVIAALVAQGYQIDYQEITGVTNDDLMEILLSADLVIDQLYSDYPMPSLATECAWLHIPVLIFGYAGECWRKWLPEEAIPPTVYRDPDTLEDLLKLMLESSSERKRIARECYKFVEANWEPSMVASRYMALFAGEVSDDWWAVRDNSYRLGACLDRADSQERVSIIGLKAEVFFKN
jgi:hypothetical protein